MKVTYFHRRPVPDLHFSVEIIFKDVREHLPTDVSYEVVTSSFYSQGLLPRLYNCLEAWAKRGTINHVTGDVHFLGILLPRRNTIQTILDCVFMKDAKGLRRLLFSWIWMKIPARRARFITTISQASKDEIVLYSGVDPEKVKVIPIALSPVFKRADRTYDWQRPRILIVGAAPNKNIPNILKALKGIDCRLSLVGRFNPEYKAMMEEFGLEHTYEWNLNVAQMYAKYLETDILMFASTYEGFGMPIIEAQASGALVVTSGISSMPEVAGENSAIFVDPYDVSSIRKGVLRAVGDPEERERLIANGYENCSRFDPVRISNMYLELYKQI
jgi:glycosyltransferase involved in cell wall biosynthesis